MVDKCEREKIGYILLKGEVSLKTTAVSSILLVTWKSFLLVVSLLHGSGSGFFMEMGQVTSWKWVRFLLHGSGSGFFFMEVGQVTSWKWVRLLHGNGLGFFMEVGQVTSWKWVRLLHGSEAYQSLSLDFVITCHSPGRTSRFELDLSFFLF